MADNGNSNGMSAIVAIIAIVAVIAVAYFAMQMFQANSAPDDNDINVTLPENVDNPVNE